MKKIRRKNYKEPSISEYLEKYNLIDKKEGDYKDLEELGYQVYNKTRRYRKKPVIVEAYQTNVEVDIKTLEGTMTASPGDYIITGIKGEKYPCKPDIFEKTYELVK